MAVLLEKRVSSIRYGLKIYTTGFNKPGGKFGWYR